MELDLQKQQTSVQCISDRQMSVTLGVWDVEEAPMGLPYRLSQCSSRYWQVVYHVAQVRDPRLVFLDEPTSGLDSEMATQVMDTLTHLARQDRLVRRSLAPVHASAACTQVLRYQRVVHHSPMDSA